MWALHMYRIGNKGGEKGGNSASGTKANIVRIYAGMKKQKTKKIK